MGGGITGCSLAHFLKDKYDVRLYESSDSLGGLLKTHLSIEGIPYQNGIFTINTQSKWVEDLIRKFSPLEPKVTFEKINPLIDFCSYDFPFTKASIQTMPFHWRESILLESEKTTGIYGDNLEKTICHFYGKTIFELFFDGFIQKLTGKKASEFSDSRWFDPYLRSIHTKKFSDEKFPDKSWAEICEEMARGASIFFNSTVTAKDFSPGAVILTIRPDYFFDGRELPLYRKSLFDMDSAMHTPQEPDTIYFPNYTPFFSMTHLGNIMYKDDKSIIIKRVIGEQGETCTPIQTVENMTTIKNYLTSKPSYFFCGPQANFSSMTISQCIESAANTAALVKRSLG